MSASYVNLHTKSQCSVPPCNKWHQRQEMYRGGGGFRPGTISQGIISPGEIFATLEIPKAPSKHVSCKMSLNFRKKILSLGCICPLRT